MRGLAWFPEVGDLGASHPWDSGTRGVSLRKVQECGHRAEPKKVKNTHKWHGMGFTQGGSWGVPVTSRDWWEGRDEDLGRVSSGWDSG